jgi:prepilin-type N-terminal cleavage/methylation domain-containing protein
MRLQSLPRQTKARAFTMVELLTVIAIIAVLAAILFPVFAQVREQARQSSTMSSLYAVYQATRLYYEDEGRFPPALFGYAEVSGRPALPGDDPATIIPMADSRQQNSAWIAGYLYREQLKSVQSFLSPGNQVTDQRAVTQVYYPLNVSRLLGLPDFTPVTWRQSVEVDGCSIPGDADLPGPQYVGQPKLFYVADSMDIGPMLDANGNWLTDPNGAPAYELHYSPNWTWRAGVVAGKPGLPAGCSDVDADGNPVSRQLKYKNPPTDRTVITYVTHHAASSGSRNVLVLLLSGATRKISVSEAAQKLPLNY